MNIFIKFEIFRVGKVATAQFAAHVPTSGRVLIIIYMYCENIIIILLLIYNYCGYFRIKMNF